MNKKKLEKLIQKKEALKKELAKKAESTEDVNELKALEAQIKALNSDIAELNEAIADGGGDGASGDGDGASDDGDGTSAGGGESRSNLGARNSTLPLGTLNPLGTYSMNQAQNQNTDPEDVFSTTEYRQAFRNYVVDGTPIPDKYRAHREQRAAEFTMVSDIGAVIPTTIVQKVIEEALSYGMILPRVTQTSFQGGVEIPVSDIKPVAVWITEDTPSETQKKPIKDKIVFAYHMLECRVSLGLLTATVSLPIFENTIIKNIKEAMIIALETGIISGSGSGQPKGILKEIIKAERTVSLDDTEISTVKGWAKVEAAVPLAYESGSVYLMAKATWESHLNGAVDTTGQKLGLVSISENQRRVLNGREVVLTDYITSYDKAASGDIFAVLINLGDYALNSNMSMSYKKYFNEDTNKWVHKSIMIADGKMADKHGMVFITKG